MTPEEKLIDIMYDLNRRLSEVDTAAMDMRHEIEKCHRFINHQAHEIAVAKGKWSPISKETRRDKIRAMLDWGMDEKFVYDHAVEAIDAFIEEYYTQKEGEE